MSAWGALLPARWAARRRLGSEMRSAVGEVQCQAALKRGRSSLLGSRTVVCRPRHLMTDCCMLWKAALGKSNSFLGVLSQAPAAQGCRVWSAGRGDTEQLRTVGNAP